jgi:membrane-associated phospholipid phosphatase
MTPNLEKMTMLWVQRISPSLMLLTATVGIIGLLGCTLSLWILEYVFTRVFGVQIYAAEVATLQWIHHQVTNPFLDMVMLSVTRLCNPEFAVPFSLVTIGILIANRARLEAFIFLISGLGAIFLDRGLKPIFSRLRPDLHPQLIQEKSFSLPSGHALGATVLYGMAAYLLATRFPKISIWIYLLTILLVIAVGFSRLYLGVHWPTDVLAGWGIGLLWLTTCIYMLRIQRLNIKHT